MVRRILSAAIFTGLALSLNPPPAQAEFGIGADVVSRYVWRGALLDDNVSVQPSLSYTSGNLEIGAWSSYAVASSVGTMAGGKTSGGANENDIYVTYSSGPIAITLTDYYFAKGAGSEFFSYSDKDAIHQLEVMGSYGQGPIGITVAAILSGDPDTPIYIDGSYELMSDDDASASLTAALGTENYYTSDGDPALINVGLSVTKGDYTAQYILNPDAEQAWMVFMMSL